MTSPVLPPPPQKNKSFLSEGPFWFYLLLALALVWLEQYATAKHVWMTGAIRDTDDAMRLVEVRDFLAGQGWFDLHQYRVMAQSGGILMHWSRLVDAPIAALILFFDFFTTRETSEILARLVWPAVLQVGLFATVLTLMKRLAGSQALFAGAIVIGFGYGIASQFEPGRIDHHSVQLLLCMLAVLFAHISLTRPKMAFWSAVMLTLMLAVGFEILAGAAILSFCFFIAWIFDRPHATQSLQFLGLGFVVSGPLVFFATMPSSLYTRLFCDAQSYALPVALLVCGLSAILLAELSPLLTTHRARIIATTCAAAAFVFLFSQIAWDCRAGPLAQVPPDIWDAWMSNVYEGKGTIRLMYEDILTTLPYIGFATVGFFCTLATFYLAKGNRWAWLPLTFLAISHFALSFASFKISAIASCFMWPACAFTVTYLRGRSQLAMAALYILLVPSFWVLPALVEASQNKEKETRDKKSSDCFSPQSYAAFAKRPVGKVLAPIDLGAHLLAYTPHNVYGAPYHRNVQGIRTSVNGLYQAEAKALPIIKSASPDYVVLCDGIGELNGIQKDAPDSIGARLLRNEKIAGFEKISGSDPVMVWKIYPRNFTAAQ